MTIAAIGDSMTWGTSGAIAAPLLYGFRRQANLSLLDGVGRAPIGWVGPNVTGENVDPVTSHHYGNPGWRTFEVTANAPSVFGPGLIEPDIFLISTLGTNNGRTDANVANFINSYKTTLQTLHSLVPPAAFVVAFVPEDPGEIYAPNMIAFNAALPAAWNDLRALGLVIYQAAASPGLTVPDMSGGDVLHPNYQTGYPKIAVQIVPPLVDAVRDILYPDQVANDNANRAVTLHCLPVRRRRRQRHSLAA